MPLQKIEWLQRPLASMLSDVGALLGVSAIDSSGVQVSPLLLCPFCDRAPGVCLWVGGGATSDLPHDVFGQGVDVSAFFLLRVVSSDSSLLVYFPYGEIWASYRITSGLVISYATYSSLSSRYSSSGVFGQWDYLGDIYCFVGFPTGGRSVPVSRSRVVPQVIGDADGVSVDLVALSKSVSALSSRVASVEKLLGPRI